MAQAQRMHRAATGAEASSPPWHKYNIHAFQLVITAHFTETWRPPPLWLRGPIVSGKLIFTGTSCLRS